MKTEEKTEAKTETKLEIVEFVPFGTKDKVRLSIEIVKRLIAVKTRSGKNCSDEDAIRFMMMCQARKLNPFEGDAFLIGYDSQTGIPSFSLITAHQAFLKRAELHPEFDGMESGTIVLRDSNITELLGDWHMPNDKILGGWATVYFKGRSHPMKKRLRLERFNKNYGIWKDDPAGMIVKCAEADALRSSFPTMLGGMYTAEESNVITAQLGEIAKPVFAEEPPTKNEKKDAVEATVVETQPEPKKAEPEPKAAEPAKKKESSESPASSSRSTLTRRAKTTKAPSAPIERTAYQRLADMLKIGNCTPQDFVSAALDEGWIEASEGTFEKIPEEKVARFLQPDNWNVVMEVLDERRAKRNTPAVDKDRLL
jgi:phage recombination protein Bet